eukprot:16428645-Heterocapsa_arctica.AAC.1
MVIARVIRVVVVVVVLSTLLGIRSTVLDQMLVAGPMVVARALSEHQQTSKHDFERKEAKHIIIIAPTIYKVYRMINAPTIYTMAAGRAAGGARRRAERGGEDPEPAGGEGLGSQDDYYDC